MTVKLILRDKEYEVKPGMTLLDSLKKINVLSESVIATRNGEMILDDEIRRLIGTKSDAAAIKQAAIAKGMITLKQEGAAKVAQGVTTMEEVMRITQQEIEL